MSTWFEVIWNTPWPNSPSTRPMPKTSSRAAWVPGTSRPSAPRWIRVREVENPSAPAASDSRTCAAIAAMSSGVATESSSAPRAPITQTRSAPCGTCAPTSIASGVRASASRYSGKVSHCQRMPSESAAPGMSSTPSISPISQSRSCGRTGAKPTPQLPITTVVTPCHDEGVSQGSQVAWPS